MIDLAELEDQVEEALGNCRKAYAAGDLRALEFSLVALEEVLTYARDMVFDSREDGPVMKIITASAEERRAWYAAIRDGKSPSQKAQSTDTAFC